MLVRRLSSRKSSSDERTRKNKEFTVAPPSVGLAEQDQWGCLSHGPVNWNGWAVFGSARTGCGPLRVRCRRCRRRRLGGWRARRVAFRFHAACWWLQFRKRVTLSQNVTVTSYPIWPVSCLGNDSVFPPTMVRLSPS